MNRTGFLWVAAATLLCPALAWADGDLKIEGKNLRVWVQESQLGAQASDFSLRRVLEYLDADPARAAFDYARERGEPMALRLHTAGVALELGFSSRALRKALERDTEFVTAACTGLKALKNRDPRCRLLAALGHTAAAAEAELLALPPRRSNDYTRLGAIASVSSEGFHCVSSWARASSVAPYALGLVGREHEAQAAKVLLRLVRNPPHYKHGVGYGVSHLPPHLSASLVVEIAEQADPALLQGLDSSAPPSSFDETQAGRFVAALKVHYEKKLSFERAWGALRVLGALAQAGDEDAIQLLVQIARTHPGGFAARRCAQHLAEANDALGSRILAEIAPKQQNSTTLRALSDAYAGKPGPSLPGLVGASTPDFLRSLPSVPPAWVQELRTLSMSGRPLQRIHAIRALTVVRAGAARKAILAATRDQDPCVSRAARIALKTRGAS